MGLSLNNESKRHLFMFEAEKGFDLHTYLWDT
jgi:hypothetical protein